MSVNSIESPFPLFTDSQGDPLESGYIYIGEANLNPEVSPVQVYWDLAMTVPASQPIRTIGGHASRNGTAARVYVNGDYSITIKDKNGVLVYSSLSGSGILVSINSLASISGLIGYTTAPDNTTVNVSGYTTANDGGGGLFNWDSTVDKSTANAGTIIDPSVSLVLQGTGVGLGCWVRESQYVTLEMFGKVSPSYFHDSNWIFDSSVNKNTANLGMIIDPTVDITIAAQGTGVGFGCLMRQTDVTNPLHFGATSTANSSASVSACMNSGTPFSLTGTIRCDDPILVSGDYICTYADAILDFSNMAAGASLGDKTAIKVAGSEGIASSIALDVTAGDNSVVVASGSGFAAGDIVILENDQYFDDAWTTAGNNRGELLEILSVATNTITFKEDIYFTYSSAFNTTLTKVNTVKVLQPKGLRMLGGGVGFGHRAFHVLYGRNSDINVDTTDFESEGVYIDRTYRYSVNTYAENCTSSATIGTTGYGVAIISGSKYGNVNVNGSNCRHLFSSGGFYPALFCTIKGYASGCGLGTYAFDCHEPSFEFDFDIVTNGGYGGIVIRGSNVKAKVNSINGSSYAAIVTTFSDIVTKQDNIELDVTALNSRGIKIDAVIPGDITNRSPIGTVVIKNANLSGIQYDGIYIGGQFEQVIIDDANISVSALGKALYVNGNTSAPLSGDVVVGKIYSIVNPSGNPAITALYANRVSIGIAEIKSISHSVYMTNVNEASIASGRLEATVDTVYPLYTVSCTNITCGADLIGTGTGTQDGWRAVDTIGGRLLNGSRVVANRHGIYSSGTSNEFIVVGVDATSVTDVTKFNLSGANNVTANNLV